MSVVGLHSARSDEAAHQPHQAYDPASIRAECGLDILERTARKLAELPPGILARNRELTEENRRLREENVLLRARLEAMLAREAGR